MTRVLVVGANGTLARATIRCLLEDGYLDITMACRTLSKGMDARQQILTSTPNADADQLRVVGGFDMNDPASIEASISDLDQAFDIVFLAAGFPVFSEDFEVVEWNGQTVEKQVFQNAMGAHITLCLLRRRGLLASNARVVVAGGEGARGIAGMIERPVFPTPAAFRAYISGALRGQGRYNAMNAIGVSKLCSALWTRKIAETSEEEFEVVWFSPGLTSQSAGLDEHLPRAKALLMKFMLGTMHVLGKAQGPREGGRKFADCLQRKVGRSGDLLGAPPGKTRGSLTDQSPLNPLFTDERFVDEYWLILEETFGPFASFSPAA